MGEVKMKDLYKEENEAREKEEIEERNNAAKTSITVFQGIGATFYGRKDYNSSDSSYITTKWFIFLLLPIFPLKSYRIRQTNSKSIFYLVAMSSQTNYEILEEIPLKNNKEQIIKTYLSIYSFIFLLIFGVYLSSIWIEFIFLPLCLFFGWMIWHLIKH